MFFIACSNLLSLYIELNSVLHQMCGIKAIESNMENKNLFVKHHSGLTTCGTNDVFSFCTVKGILALRHAMEVHNETGLLKGLNEIAASLKLMEKEFHLMHGK